jgi:FixJ family two-component response regulator
MNCCAKQPSDPKTVPRLKVKMREKIMVSIVDDDPSVCEGLQDLLSSMGFGAETFHNADEFLGSGRLGGTTCLIADVQMPGMTGLELHDHLTKAGKNVPTILITAYPRAADRAKALRNGVHCYLAKPFSEIDLLSCIRSAIPQPGAA